MKRTDILPAAIVAALIALMALTYFAHPAYGQELERCTVQSFDPPIGPTFTMPGDADRVTITLVDGISTTLIGPFVQGDVIDAGGPVVELRKCSGSGVPPTTPPTPTATPEPTPELPTPEPQPTPTPIVSCCTTIVTPGPEPTPTPVVPIIPTPPTPPTPTPTEVVPTPTPTVPRLPETGASSALLAVIGGALVVAGGVLMAARR